MANNYMDISQIALTSEERRVLSRIQEEGAIPDTDMRRPPNDFLLRQGLIEHSFSSKFPCILHSGEVSVPRNALTLTDRGRCWLARQAEADELREQHVQQIAEERNYQEASEDKRQRQKFAHDWKIAVFSAVAGALLARPLWAGIDWLFDLAGRLFG